MKQLLIVLSFTNLMVTGCLDPKESGVKKKVVNDFSFVRDCEPLLKEPSNTTADNGQIVYRSYKYKQNNNIKLEVGVYGHLERSEMRGEGVPTGRVLSQPSAGNFDATVRFMNQKGITCQYSSESLKLIFPTPVGSSQKHKDEYGDLTVHAPNHRVRVGVGLNRLDGDKLMITVTFTDPEEPYFHAFDTNSRGEIIKHVEVNGEGGQERVLLPKR